MKVNRLIFFNFILIFLLITSNCKKTENYPLSDEIKEYFAFQKGSYWIYKNDSTNIFDSTSIESYFHNYNDNTYSDITREIIEMTYKSSFLSSSIIEYSYYCGGPNNYSVSSILKAVPGQIEAFRPVAYNPKWPPNQKIIPDCAKDAIFFYQTMKSDTVNHIPYNDIIYSEFRSSDSSLSNPYLYIRKIYFAKHVGIVKFYELNPYYKINRSYTLIRYKVLQ